MVLLLANNLALGEIKIFFKFKWDPDGVTLFRTEKDDYLGRFGQFQIGLQML